jgi:hypothetical protein
VVASDPLVTSVGGTLLNLDDQGNRLSPDVVWNDTIGAGGGGVSGVFSRPLYQAGVAKEVGSKRGTPDISMSAATGGAAWIYTSFGGVSVGWHLVGGTSEASPAPGCARGPATSCLAYRLIQPVTMGAWSEPSRQRRLIWPDGMSSALNRPSVSASTVVTPWPCLMSTTADCRGMSCPIRRR